MFQFDFQFGLFSIVLKNLLNIATPEPYAKYGNSNSRTGDYEVIYLKKNKSVKNGI